ncbi:transglutaminaseTgpA domain-containing protein [Shewanella sp. YIC-542]|uniref:transglutaminase family protein n=1 Tax=Shewanella mytili TaxID=3377111 RepID=UPI00398E74FA
MTNRDHLSQRTLFWLLLTNVAILLPLYDKAASATLAIGAICFLWRLGIYFGKVARPPRLLVTLLAVAAALTLALVSRELGLLNALINLLILGYALKYIEARCRRDVRVIVLAGYFLVALTLIDHQGIGYVLLLAPVIAINTLTLISLYLETGNISRQGQLTLKLLLQSLPLALLLFITIPRLPPLWMVPQLKSATTGLSDTVGFGDISRLTRSAQLAFRVTYEQQRPPAHSLYWRALVLEDYDGKHWRQSPTAQAWQSQADTRHPQRPRPQETQVGERLDYTVIAESSGQHWLFAMGNAFSDTPGVFNMPDYRLYASRPLEQKFQYRVQQYLHAPRQQALSEAEYQRNLALPAHANPRSQALALQLRQHYPEPAQRLQAMMRFFNHQPFSYTLTPPLTGPQQLDDFLFETRAGFCVHYASAFTFLARASGLPARMVAGYQGGEFNPQAGYLSVYQYMAHAWSEVWLEGQGWVRFDPTAMIAPERIEQGFDSIFSPEDSYLANTAFIGIRTSDWFQQLRLKLASLDYYWTVWVLGFDNNRQQQLLNQLLGKITLSRMALLVLGVMTLALGYIAYSSGLLRRPTSLPQVDKDFRKICQLVARKGLQRQPGCGPQDFITQMACHFPSCANLISHWGEQYLQLKYAKLTPHAWQQAQQSFHQLTRQLVQQLSRSALAR